MILQSVLGKLQPSERYYEVRLCSGVMRGCVNRIQLWPLRRDDYSGVMIGQHACWLMTEARESIDSPPSFRSGSRHYVPTVLVVARATVKSPRRRPEQRQQQ